MEKDKGLPYSKLNRDGEEVAASLLGNGITARNAGEVDVARLNEALLALDSPEELLGKSDKNQSTVLGQRAIVQFVY